MSSVVEICNMAIIACGSDTIASLTEPGKKAARLCNAMYEPTRDALLRSHPWNFAVKRALLARLPDAPASEYDYQFSLPDDCLKVQEVYYDDDCPWPYRIEQSDAGAKVLVTNADVVYLEYIAKVTDPNLMDAAFRQALALALAVAICMALTDNAAMRKALAEEAKEAAMYARSVDSHEGSPRDPNDDDLFLRARI